MYAIDMRTDGAVLSDDQQHRYALVRRFDTLNPTLPALVWIMLNPSTADASLDDPTIRKCVGFTKRLGGYGALVVVNLYAFRATDPRALVAALRSQDHARVVGPENDGYILSAVEGSDVIAAWGATPVPGILQRIADVRGICDGARSVRCLGLSKGGARQGQPRHPLMLAYETPAEPFYWDAASKGVEEGR